MSWLDRTGTRRAVLATGAGMFAASIVNLPAAGAQAQQTFTNPAVWQDFADVDIIRVGDTFYLSASTMHYSPGAPVLRSWDLVNWEFAGHSVPRLDFGAKYDLNGGRGYVRGIWASSLNHRPSDGRFYWIGQIDFASSYVYTAASAEGPWSRHAQIGRSYFDAGLLFDDDDSVYVAYGNTEIRVAQLSADATREVRDQAVFQTPNPPGVLEGARFYKIGGNYYIFLTRPANGQYILKSNSPWGPYEMRQLLLDLPGPIDGGGVPHQGGLVDTPAATGTTWPSPTPTPAAGCRPWPRSPGPATAGRSSRPSTANGERNTLPEPAAAPDRAADRRRHLRRDRAAPQVGVEPQSRRRSLVDRRRPALGDRDGH
ncbi:hypothetical protein GCM10029992_33120 [Glycomyces albus]